MGLCQVCTFGHCNFSAFSLRNAQSCCMKILSGAFFQVHSQFLSWSIDSDLAASALALCLGLLSCWGTNLLLSCWCLASFSSEFPSILLHSLNPDTPARAWCREAWYCHHHDLQWGWCVSDDAQCVDYTRHYVYTDGQKLDLLISSDDRTFSSCIQSLPHAFWNTPAEMSYDIFSSVFLCTSFPWSCEKKCY